MPTSAPIPDCTGALLAGGRGTRLGGLPKGMLRVDGAPIAARALALLGRLFDDALLVTSAPGPYAALNARVVPDLLAGRGAPGGLHAALSAARTGWVFIAACDMPFLAEAPIRLLAARRAGAAAVIPRWEGRLQPLHACWSRACLPVLARLLAEGEPSLRALAAAVDAREVDEAELRAADPTGRALANVNTAEDAARLGLRLDLHQL